MISILALKDTHIKNITANDESINTSLECVENSSNSQQRTEIKPPDVSAGE